MIDGYKYFRRYEFAPELFDEIADGASSAGILVFVTESLPNTHSGMSLLARSLKVVG